MSKKLNILPGTGFLRRNSAALKENLCSVIPTPYSSWEKENASVVPPKATRARTTTPTRVAWAAAKRGRGSGRTKTAAG